MSRWKTNVMLGVAIILFALTWLPLRSWPPPLHPRDTPVATATPTLTHYSLEPVSRISIDGHPILDGALTGNTWTCEFDLDHAPGATIDLICRTVAVG